MKCYKPYDRAACVCVCVCVCVVFHGFVPFCQIRIFPPRARSVCSFGYFYNLLIFFFFLFCFVFCFFFEDVFVN